jgi:hypothetical protein
MGHTKTQNFPEFVYGVKRSENNESLMPQICKIMSERLSNHLDDIIIS